MYSSINSRPMAQMVAFDIMAEEARQAQARRGRRERRGARGPATWDAESLPLETGRPRWRIARALHLVH